eukprot:jgi/Chlat1/1356/Chrsp119S01788
MAEGGGSAFGVRISSRLLDRLNGNTARRSQQHHHEQQQRGVVDRVNHQDASSPHQQRDGEARVGDGALHGGLFAPPRLRPSQPAVKPEVQQALAHSARVGDLLLKREEEELAKVDTFAKELHEKEYVAPMRPTPCEAERETCVKCYKEHPEDPLRCGAAVKAFSACARKAQQAFVQEAS